MKRTSNLKASALVITAITRVSALMTFVGYTYYQNSWRAGALVYNLDVECL